MRFRAVLLGVLCAISVAGICVPTPSMAQASSSCPIPLDKQLDSIKAFEPIARFVTREPRCFNCHGGVNPHIDGIGRDPGDPNAPVSTVKHGGGAQDRGEKGLMAEGCENCHDNMVAKRDGSPSKWFTAPPVLSFVGKTAPELCKQFKRTTETATHFLGHLEDDNGGNNFSKTAFLGNRGLNEEWYTKGSPPAPPSLSHSAFKGLGEKWIEAMGGKFQGDEGCGCDIELELEIEHHLADRRDTDKFSAGFAVFTSDIRFEAQLKSQPWVHPATPVPNWLPPEVFTKTLSPKSPSSVRLVAKKPVDRTYSVGHVTPRCVGSVEGTEIWFVQAALDPDTGMLDLAFELGATPTSNFEGYWVCDGERDDVGVDIFSEIYDHAPFRMPAASGSRQRFVIPHADGVDEFLTVTVK